MKPARGTPARILIVDDHPMVRDGLAMRIANEPDLTVCGEAEDSVEALQLVNDLNPDMAIVDISLKSGHGIDLIKHIRKHYAQVKMLAHSMYDESVYAERALQAGALGYLTKRSSSEAVIDAIHQVLAGKVYLSPDMTDRIARNMVGGTTKQGKAPVECLSVRELEVLTLIGRGHMTREIADRLSLSVHTIDTHREKLKLKLALNNGAELSRYAVQWVLESGS